MKSYGEMLKPSPSAGFLAFGAGSIPAGWLGDRWSRRGMMIVFFVGIGAAAILAGACAGAVAARGGADPGRAVRRDLSPGWALRCWSRTRRGSAATLGINGIWGNLGVAFAALAAGGLAEFARVAGCVHRARPGW